MNEYKIIGFDRYTISEDKTVRSYTSGSAHVLSISSSGCYTLHGEDGKRMQFSPARLWLSVKMKINPCAIRNAKGVYIGKECEIIDRSKFREQWMRENRSIKVASEDDAMSCIKRIKNEINLTEFALITNNRDIVVQYLNTLREICSLHLLKAYNIQSVQHRNDIINDAIITLVDKVFVYKHIYTNYIRVLVSYCNGLIKKEREQIRKYATYR